MDEPTTLMHIAKKCECVSTHCPSAYVPNHHHILPQSWGGLTNDANMVWLCPNSHTAVHDLLNQYIYAGGTPEGGVLMHYTGHVQNLAARAWEQRPNERPPFTSAHP
jgi:hypothetical protein